jgi:hypothetical protein
MAGFGSVLVLAWQFATVHANYGGNWTALFTTGAQRAQPPIASAERVYVFPKTHGFDGQFYHYIAHDPFLRAGLKNYIDDPRLRYHRIFVPLLAHALAFGNDAAVDRAYEFMCLLSIAFGIYWSCRFAQSAELNAAWGLLFLAMPAIPITMDRLVVDATLAALTTAFLCYSRSPSWKLFVILVCAALTRETGALLILACCLSFAWRRKFRSAALFLLSAGPAAAWYLYVQTKTMYQPYPFSLIPFSAIVHVFAHPAKYPAGTPLAGAVVLADYLALAGVVLAFVLALLWFARSPADPIRSAAALFAATGIIFQRVDHWQNVFDFGRVYTPALICLAAMAAENRNPWLLAPVAMMLPRVAIQLAPQALGILHSMA